MESESRCAVWTCPVAANSVFVLCRYFLMLIWSYELFWSVQQQKSVWMTAWQRWCGVCARVREVFFNVSCCNFVATYQNAVTWHAPIIHKKTSCNSSGVSESMWFRSKFLFLFYASDLKCSKSSGADFPLGHSADFTQKIPVIWEEDSQVQRNV